MQEIKDREVTKEVKGHAMAELKKVADIKEKVGNVELPVGAAEKVGVTLSLTSSTSSKLSLTYRLVLYLSSISLLVNPSISSTRKVLVVLHSTITVRVTNNS